MELVLLLKHFMGYDLDMMKHFATLLFVFSVFPAMTFAYSGKVTYIQGDVTLKAGGKNAKAVKDSAVKEGDVVTTGTQSLAIIDMADGAQLKLNENSSLQLPPKQEGAIVLSSGSVFSKIPKQKLKQQFKIITPTAVMGVRGTQFFTSYGTDAAKASDIWMCVHEGSVSVTSTSSNKSVLVKEGEGVLVPAKSDVTPPQKYAWTKDLNWNLDPASGSVENKIKIRYEKSLLKEDYN